MRVARDYEEGSALAADQLKVALREKPDLLLCAATGASPARAYELLARSILSSQIPSAALRVLKLDEWGGLPMDDSATCEAHLQRLLVQPLKIDANRFISFRSDTPSPEKECQRIGGWLMANGPIDVCVLGLGINGHLGFNEPADELTAGCHVAPLTDESMAHPMLSGTRRRPGYGLTLGIREILASRTILLLVFGAGKAAQLERLFTGGISTRFPGSFLALHQRVVCICDEAAAVRLPAELKRESVQ
jgi:galactosamine-6-phosphate isomerase